MKIALFELEGWEKEYLQKNSKLEELDADYVFVDDHIDHHNLPSDKDFDVISVFIESVVNRAVIEQMPNLKYVTVRATGYDNIDLEACKERGIKVSNVPNYGENTVAEYTMGLMLTLSRNIYQAYDQVREQGSFQLTSLRGHDLLNKTLGVIGTGRIGKHVVKMAKAFEMNVLAFDLYPDKSLEKEFGVKYVTLEELLKSSDIISLHVPYSKDTHHIINSQNINIVKNGALIINTSRGSVIETEALVRGIKDKTLAGAALDVLEEESGIRDELALIVDGHSDEHNLKNILANHVLIDMPNVIVTPHNAFNSWEALQRILNTTVDNVDSFIRGETDNIVKELQDN